MHKLDVVIPVMNEEKNIAPLMARLERAMRIANISYKAIFVVDKSHDNTLPELKKAAKKYPILIHEKTGERGKAFSIFEGVGLATSEYVVMIDGDLQYPPEAIPEMYSLREKFGLVVANRSKQDQGKLRSLFSKANRFIFGKVLLGWNFDSQSGLKLFKREIFDFLDKEQITEWALDVPLIYTARELGFEVGSVDITFSERANGKSSIKLVSASLGIMQSAVKQRLQTRKVYTINPKNQNSMIGYGTIYKKRRFITHTNLEPKHSAVQTLINWQKVAVVLAGLTILAGLVINPILTISATLAVLSIIYFVDVIFTLFLVTKSLQKRQEISFSETELKSVNTKDLPTYSVLCPLYKEAGVLPQFVKNMQTLVYPKNKLEVLLLLEENDTETILSAQRAKLPKFIKIVIVPDSQPKTKPKACNYGLSISTGELVVIYDAEDQPEPLQLIKAALAFKNAPEQVCCLQAKLNYYNPNQNILTRLFTAEYSLWFDLMLPAFQSIETTIPLGGTSNHFRRELLVKLGGWDAFNVTEDCDLGARLFKNGYKTAIIDSVTLEEANSDLGNWIRQRSRWIKGYIQTYLVHMRNPFRLVKQLGTHAIIFQLVIGARTTFMLINPILWIMTISYFVLYRFVGPTIESFYPAPIFYMAVFSLTIGNFLYLYIYMIAVAKRNQWDLVKFIFLVPVYWLLVSLAALKAFKQLIFQPHFWEKTNHGLQTSQISKAFLPKFSFERVLRPEVFAAAFLVFSTLGNYFLNFLYNAYLTRAANITISEFGLISLIGSFVYLSLIPMGALIRTVAHQSAFYFGGKTEYNRDYWSNVRIKAKAVSLTACLVWVALTPLLQIFFNSESPLPFLIFTPVWFIGTLNAVDVGFLTGSLKFSYLGWLLLSEAITRLLLTIIIVSLGLPQWVYLATPLSMMVSFGLGYLWASQTKRVKSEKIDFSTKFFGSSIILNLSSVVYLGGDILLARHFLSPVLSGEYAILSLIGKMVFFLGSLFSQFVVPIISKAQGAGYTTGKYFKLFFFGTFATGFSAFLFFGVFGDVTVPFFWAQKSLPIIRFLPMFTFAMMLFSLSALIVNFHQTQGKKFFAVASFSLSLTQVVFIVLRHNTILDFVHAALYASSISLLTMLAMHFIYPYLPSIKSNAIAFVGLFKRLPDKAPSSEKNLRILVFNWRDTKHVWAGGAEVYIQKLSESWAKLGHSVTIFSGNDGKSLRSETLNGVQIVRRGGFAFVYVWAILYYLIRFRGRYDVIVDCENGIPFFMPLFAKEKVVLVIHAVHQEIFRNGLPLPLYYFAAFLEKIVMPLVYRNTQVVTVSESSKKEILEHKLTHMEPAVVHNGIDLTFFKPGTKSKTPLVIYVGRLKKHKSLKVFINMAKRILDETPNVEFVIAGDGPDKKPLFDLVKKLKLTNQIKFTGKISEEEKLSLYQKAWVFVNPSMKEGWGITSIEANACGTPVVASNVPGLRDSVQNPHTGFLVKYGDTDRFAERVMALINNKSFREQTGKYGISWAKKYDWDKSASEFINVLKHE